MVKWLNGYNNQQFNHLILFLTIFAPMRSPAGQARFL